MWTIKYKNAYINGYCDKDLCSVVISPSGYGYTKQFWCRSLHAAKCRITRYNRETGNH